MRRRAHPPLAKAGPFEKSRVGQRACSRQASSKARRGSHEHPSPTPKALPSARWPPYVHGPGRSR
eukprot:scaffold201936_cov31-Tisochrysis_lutea.AAC.2